MKGAMSLDACHSEKKKQLFVIFKMRGLGRYCLSATEAVRSIELEGFRLML